ncbi:MAG: DUF4340 domain-containing protein [Thiohalocapsa sp.]|jgi:hypothetical protein
MSETTIGTSRVRFDPSWRGALKTPLVIGLGAALAVQLTLALLLGAGPAMAPAEADAPLLTFDADKVTGIEIRAGDSEDNVTLTRIDDGWVLSDLGDFPASATRVDQLLDSLAALRRPLPVATSEDAARRFKVAGDRFERRLTLRAGDDDIGTLILGDSPGFRRLFARVDGEEAIYDLRLALFDLSAAPDDWIDRGRLQLEQDRIRRVAGPDWTLSNGDDGWTLEGSDEAPDADAVGDLLSSLSSLGYRGVLGAEERPEYGLDSPAASLAIELDDGEKRTYRIAPLADESDYVLKREDDPYYYRLARFDVEGLLDLTADRLLGREPAPDDASAEGADEVPQTELAIEGTADARSAVPVPHAGGQPDGAAEPDRPEAGEAAPEPTE